MSRRKGNYKVKLGDASRTVLENIDQDNVVIKMFQEYSAALDERHDRYERIVKLSRDITIESKRIIFLLHNKETDIEDKRDKIFADAKVRLDAVVLKHFKAIAVELDGQDAYQYLRAYTNGVQEFVEALLFLQFLKTQSLETWEVIDNHFTYTLTEEEEEEKKVVKLLFPQLEYILGIGDFTGELMRKCINNLAAGKIDDCFKICDFVKYIQRGFLGINTQGNKEIGRKLYVLKQSLIKMEQVCYNIKVRGSEVPKHMLGLVLNRDDDMLNLDDDEGYF